MAPFPQKSSDGNSSSGLRHCPTRLEGLCFRRSMSSRPTQTHYSSEAATPRPVHRAARRRIKSWLRPDGSHQGSSVNSTGEQDYMHPNLGAGRFTEFLRQVRVVEAHVHRLHQVGDLLAHGIGQPSRRRPPATAMPQGEGPPSLEAPLESLDLSDTETQRRRRLAVGDPARADRLQQSGTMQLLPAQRESLHGGMTLSRSSYPMTFSRSTSTGAVTGLTDLRRSPTLPPWISPRTQLSLNLSSPTPVQ